ncbi:hypothetical protein FOZ63_015978, partial [Perkinsus olseni]
MLIVFNRAFDAVALDDLVVGMKARGRGRPPGDDAAPIPTVLSRRLRVLGDSGGPGAGGSMSKAVVDAAADVGVFSIRFGQESLADSGEENQ